MIELDRRQSVADGRHHLIIPQAQLEELLTSAAKRGAAEALSHVGLHDEDAGADIRDLRQLIDGWRDMKHTAARAVVKWFMMIILGLISVGAYFNLK
jgi:hypothetical protein